MLLILFLLLHLEFKSELGRQKKKKKKRKGKPHWSAAYQLEHLSAFARCLSVPCSDSPHSAWSGSIARPQQLADCGQTAFIELPSVWEAWEQRAQLLSLLGEQGLDVGSVVESSTCGCWAGWAAGGCVFRKTSQPLPDHPLAFALLCSCWFLWCSKMQFHLETELVQLLQNHY